MTELDRKDTIYELVQNDGELRAEVSTARFMNRVSSLLGEALRQSGMTQGELAEAMKVSNGRVSQILGDPGNLRISTVVRFLGATGYDPHIYAKSITNGETMEAPRKRRKRKGSSNSGEPVTVFAETFVDENSSNATGTRIIFQNSPTSRNTNPAEWENLGTYPRGSHGFAQIQSWKPGAQK